MARGYDHASRREHPGHRETRVALGRKRDDARESAAASSSRAIASRSAGRIASRGCAPRYPSVCVDERTFDVKSGDQARGERIALAQARPALASRRHIASRSSVMIVARNPPTPSASSRSHARCRSSACEVVLVEVNAGVAVDLQVEECCLSRHCRPACPPRPPASASSSSLVHGRVRPVVAARVSFTSVRIDRRGLVAPLAAHEGERAGDLLIAQ